ncbi:F-box/kelch-repeat protein At1g74510-like [Durio zibethinus]|uniref:F-box/kelch-repeat protein At1g74510-like n=1 Tax=Durio zibethinus TaxID=66656 RepID=A0A6P5XJ49_DURZI|nr:F-box/kelch-repeat protein At1g74510-like [Durio zibethinus]XP_022727823.1 F-box/kelch-repeat protein At1g74510-like [Durio zibethinus]XP_022727832.1 F-box/kelch-repeat protein At1g74510-like [Durio zibethinus]
MLEGPSYLVSRDLPSSCEQESKWIYNTFHVIELSRSKRQMEDGEDQMARKVLKPLEDDENVEKEDMSLAQIDQPDNHRHSGDHSESSLLIHQLGRDISINCLLLSSRSDYGTIASLNSGFRSVIRSGELYRLRREMGIVEHWVYFSCSLLEWRAFDPIRQRWMHLPRMTSNECFMFSDKESLAVGTELLVFGKEITSHVIYRYSILTNTWSSGMEMNRPRCLFGSASLGEIAILAGGCDPHGNILSSAELYNSETGKWVTIPSMNKARKMCSGVFMDGKFYVIGGIGVGNSRTLTCGEVYDLKMKTWREIPNMFPARNGGPGAPEAPATAEAPPLVAVVNNELYAADYAQQEVRKYDKENNLWVTLGRLPERAFSMNGWGLAFRACGDQLVVIGGPRALGEGMIEVNSWVPNEGPPQWNLLVRKPFGSFVYNCAVMGC